MDFEEIENLEEEQLNEMYNDIVDFGDDAHLAACCCVSRAAVVDYGVRVWCVNWCRAQSSTCRGWGDIAGSPCVFRC